MIKIELEEQVSNKELSKKLKELGVKQESMFYWIYNSKAITGNGVILESKIKINTFNKEWSRNAELYSAFTVAELGGEDYYTIKTGANTGDDWECINEYDVHLEYANTEADARAKMKIYLIEK